MGMPERLIKSRMDAGYKNVAAAAAEMEDVSDSALRRYEWGERVPGANALATICGVYRVSSDYLLGIRRRAS